jgi:site-specific recombinase XerD
MLPQASAASIDKVKMPKLTKRVIDGLRPIPGSDLFAWDSELRGFGIRMKPSGSASFLVQYRTAQGNTRRLAFARVGTITPDQARTRARRLLMEVEDGGDPSAGRHDARAALTVAQLCELYMDAARAGLVATRFRKPKRKSTIINDEGRVSRHIVPLLGGTVATKLTRTTVQRMVDSIAAGKTAGTFKTKPHGKSIVEGGASTAARVVELLGGIWTWGEKRGLVAGPNPVRGVEKHCSNTKERVLSPEELARLGAVLQRREADRPMARDAVRLIALTGLRREEACGLRWREINAEGSFLRLSASKTGRSTRPLGKAASDMLRALPKLHDEFVFPNRNGSGSADLKKAIAALFDGAGLKDARSHDLRRTFASTAAELGYSDATIAELIGHARRGVTERHYVRRPDAVLIAAADRVTARITAAMEGSAGAEIFPIKKTGGMPA